MRFDLRQIDEENTNKQFDFMKLKCKKSKITENQQQHRDEI